MLRTRVRAGAIAGFVMSLVFASILTTTQAVELLVPALASHARRVGLAFGSAGSQVSQVRLLAALGIHFTLFCLVSLYLRRFGISRTRLMRTQVGLFTAMTLAVVVAKALLLFTSLPEFWIPVAAVPLWCVQSIDRRTAFLVTVMLAFMTSALMRFDVLLLLVLITRGLAASLLFVNTKKPRQMVFAGLGGGLIASAVFAAVVIVFEGRFSPETDAALGIGSRLLACAGGGVVAGILGVGLRLPAERLLGGVSRDRLLDLTDLEQPLLLKMASEAPGSWEHSRAMANLAEAAAAAIGADPLLTRVGAYYHDLGKTIQPKYFVENLAHDERSPHDELEPEVSADAIMAHVVQGAKLLREGGVPEPVVEFAYTHHGTQVIEYFWHKCRERGNPRSLREDSFRYPGMKPQTKETAILMLVDSIEAASRTIQPPERAKFEEMVQRILFTKLKSGQIDDSGLTLEDLRIICVKMTETLVNMFHGRIKYPWQREGPDPVDLRKVKGQTEKPN